MPALFRNAFLAELPLPATAVPSSTTTAERAATPTATTPPTATSTPTITEPPMPPTPGVPACDRTTGDAGGFRFSLDGGVTLAPNARRLASVAYTWDLEVDPRDPDAILELHQGRLFRSPDAGCTFAEIPGVPAAEWDRLTRAPSAPDTLVLTSVFASRLAVTMDGGATWTTQELPDDVMDLAIDPADPWRWTFVGRAPAIYSRAGPAERWTAQPIPLDAGQSVISAAYAPSRPERWLVASATRGLYRSDDGGATWVPASEGLFAPVGEPPGPTTAVVVASITFAPACARSTPVTSRASTKHSPWPSDLRARTPSSSGSPATSPF